MASKRQFHVGHAAVAPDDDGSSEEEETDAGDGVVDYSASRRQGLKMALALAGLVCVAGCATLATDQGSQMAPRLLSWAAAATSRASLAPQPTSPGSPEKLTVRSLLAGSELTDVATENMVAMGEAGSRDDLRMQVASGFQDISTMLQERDPEAHRRLGELELTEEQKNSALHVLRKFSDSRLVGLTKDIAEATSSAKNEDGTHDEQQLRRRLSEKLLPRATEVRALSEELFPGRSPGTVAIPLNGQDWHAEVEVDLRDSDVTSSRRLYTSEPGRGVRAQAKTVFGSLEETLGEKMPKVCRRMLSDFYNTDGSPKEVISAPATFEGGEETFMQCVMRTAPSPMDVCNCITSHMEQVVEMMVDYVESPQ